MKYLVLVLLLTSFPTLAFDCKEIENKEFLSPGDSDFQYHYRFFEGRAYLLAFTESHDAGHGKVKTDKFQGTYKYNEKEKDKFTVDIKVDGVSHKITFQCVDKVQYMNAGKFSKSLRVFKTIPENHAFSLIDLWPKESPVIRRYLPAKGHSKKH